YDGTTGAFLGTFVTPDSGGLKFPTFLTFTETDPTTPAYIDGNRLTAPSAVPHAVKASLHPSQAQAPHAEAFARWRTSGVDTSGLGSIRIQIANLGGTTLGLASGHTIWLDDNAAGWGWFVDKTPWDDSEFITPGTQGEQNRIDLLSSVMHEM